MLMKLLAQSPDGTLMCCANETHLKFVDSRFLKLYETNTPGAIMAASFHPQKYELFLKIDNRTLVSLCSRGTALVIPWVEKSSLKIMFARLPRNCPATQPLGNYVPC
jgi:hypothetical protein